MWLSPVRWHNYLFVWKHYSLIFAYFLDRFCWSQCYWIGGSSSATFSRAAGLWCTATHPPVGFAPLQPYVFNRLVTHSSGFFYFYRAALNVLVFGEKYWSLIPPAEAIYSTTPALPWFREDLQTTQSNTLRCIQRAGDVLFVPPMWSHATLNLDESVGFSTELEWGQLILD
jgi:hypothetical protein